jgi:hypothetical protein
MKTAQQWLADLQLSKKEDEAWVKRGRKIIKRYRDERSQAQTGQKRFNILWSNIQTLLPALYGKTPRAQVERRYKDQDPVGRTASTILERCLQYEIDHYGDFDASSKLAILDRLLPGRGVTWVRFETKEQDEVAEGGEVDKYEYECSPVDYVFWEDFRYTVARTWDEVTWVARRVYMTRAEVISRFGDKFKDVPLTQEPIGLDDMKRNGEQTDHLKRAQIWEIWDKSKKQVVWVAEGYEKILDERKDPYGLDGFYPCPCPLFATQTSDQLVPVPDFALYQDQADEIDMLTTRIGMLTKAVKVVGVYDASQTGIQRMLNEGFDNQLIPVDKWAAFAEKGGVKGTIDWLPLDVVVGALNECYKAREAAKQVIYEITGLSDIIRGASVASETATAQQIKSQYASLRLKRLQQDVALFATEILRIKAQLISDFYSPETLLNMSGIQGTQDEQYAEAAIQLIKDEPARNFRIEVAADSMVEMDEISEKQSRMEFLTAAGQFMQQSLPVAQAQPALAPLIGEMLMFGVRSFKGARTLENAFEQALAKMSEPQQPQGPSPEQMQAQADQQAEQARMQLEGAKMQASQQLEAAKLQSQQALEAQRFQHETQLESMKQQAETERATMKANLDAQVKLEIAQMTASAAEKPSTTVQFDAKDQLGEIGETIKGMAGESGAVMAEMVNQLSTSAESIAQAANNMAMVAAEIARPKRKVGRKLADGSFEMMEQ